MGGACAMDTAPGAISTKTLVPNLSLEDTSGREAGPPRLGAQGARELLVTWPPPEPAPWPGTAATSTGSSKAAPWLRRLSRQVQGGRPLRDRTW